MRIFLLITLACSYILVSAQELKITRKYEIVKLEGGINTRNDDAAPVISPDGNTLYYFINNHPDNTYGEGGSQDIWVSRKGEDGVWGPGEHLGSPLNENHGNQVFSVLNGGNTLFVRGGSKKESQGFSITNRSGNNWSRLVELEVAGFEELNKNRFYGATMSSDMEHMIIYFSTNPRLVWSDLYYSKRISGNKFSRPVKLKGGINTGWDEFGPFLSPDNNSIYFASDRKGDGLGGADLYVSRRLDDTWLKWSEPENLGAPINTSSFDGYISVDASGNIYIAMAGKKIDGGNLDILQVVPKDIHIYLEGIVNEAGSEQPLLAQVFLTQLEGNVTDTLTSGSKGFESTLGGEGKYRIVAKKEGYNDAVEDLMIGDVYNDTTIYVTLELASSVKEMRVTVRALNSKTNELIPEARITISQNQIAQRNGNTEKSGSFSWDVPNPGSYDISGTAVNYFEGFSAFNIDQEENDVYVDVLLEPIEIGTTVVLENIYFDFDKTTLKSESYIELDKVVQFLNDNATLKIEISGHTDAKGGDDYNLNLSQGRAEAVVQYLIDNGIVYDRLVAQGYGENKPVASNDTDEGRAQNRRVEFTVLEM